ncbi:MAG TPA: carboxypeptidase-like regulatory domain-containing protein [Candidatus Angelobacter sp.]|nr:carboxypeptidase-like regulatory domain-containing protein [Candidatus Angelobacter sp.]
MAGQSLPPVTPNNPPVPSVINSGPKGSASAQNREEIFRQAVEGKNSPIHFYGKVVDQNGIPIPGVNVQVKVRQWYTAAPETKTFGARMIPIEKQTGTDGRFEVQDVDGDGFDVESIVKEGYKLSPKAPREFGVSSGSPEGPVIIKMWKKGTTEPLVSEGHFFGFEPDGRTYSIDLMTGKKTEGSADGDIQIQITRPHDIHPHERYPWSIQIIAPSGGLVEATDEFRYEAPENGYAPSVKIEMDPTDPAWIDLLKKAFYVKSRTGSLYGTIQMTIHPDYQDKSAIEFQSTVNPAGSRNLQP